MSGEVKVLSRAERLGSLAAAISCIAVFGASITLMSPVISLNLEARGVDSTTIGVLGSAPAIGMLIANFIIPALVRWLDLRRFLFACIGAQLVLVLLMPVFDSVPAWFILRALTGMTMNGLFVASETWINAVAEERSRGRVIAVYGATLSASFALAPLLVPLTGTEGWPPFLACAGLISLAAIPLLRAGHLSPELGGKSSFNIISFLWIAPTLAAAVFLTAFKEMSLGSILPVYGVRNGLSEASAATLLTAAYGGALLLQFPIGWLADHVDRMRLLLVFTVIGLIGALLLPLMIEAPSVILWLGLGCWVGLFTGIYIVAMTLVGQRFKGAELVTANASFGLLWGIGSLFGPAFSGRAMDIWDPNGFPATLGIVTALVLAVMLYRTFRRPAKTRPPS